MTTTGRVGAREAPIPASATAAQPRRTGLDALRILLCGMIILAHALLIFAEEPRYHLKSATPSPVASVLYEFMRATTMAVFFTLAGWSALAASRTRSPGRFMQDRTMRLLLPLIVGSLLLGSIIKYVELSHGRDLGFYGLRLVEPLQGGFFDFFPRNLKRLKELTWSHLWFLGYQFIISLLLLPLLLLLARRAPNRTLPLALTVYLPALPMAALLVAFDGYWPFLPNLINDWTNFAYFALCFLIGAVIAAWPGFEERLRAEAPRLLLLMVVSFAGLVLCGESTAGRVFVALTGWGAIGAGLGYAARFKPPATPAFLYLSEATGPVYIVHHVPSLLLGALVLQLPLPVWLKIVLIGVGTAIISLATYHWLVRSWPPVRWLMGMVPVPRKPMPAAPKPST